MENIPEIELKLEIDYDPRQIYRDTSNNYIRVLHSLKAYQNGKLYENSAHKNKVYLKVLYFNNELKEEQIGIDDFEARLIAGEVEEYSPNDTEKAKLALRGFFR